MTLPGSGGVRVVAVEAPDASSGMIVAGFVVVGLALGAATLPRRTQ